ncbi:hypothetical protein DUZ99_13300 [Xylanibacillus composti]|uniref:Uncharacterized protein n=1 Tax=Xylanibacillus composti TaxID=1572762 RepID=A0A8J4M3V9_9BACL|nr:hypothetical protein [Xylanibacillus composti]MDT9725951.1 hypothetical protein [Xylanibacillus composti]GIQ71265.1 hypothetical protein XYCOK13_40890 [Xylanibacillus composti]
MSLAGKSKKVSLLLLAFVVVSLCLASTSIAASGIQILNPVNGYPYPQPPTSIDFEKADNVRHYQLAISQVTGGNFVYHSGVHTASWVPYISHVIPSNIRAQMTPGTYFVYIEGYYNGGYYS